MKLFQKVIANHSLEGKDLTSEWQLAGVYKEKPLNLKISPFKAPEFEIRLIKTVTVESLKIQGDVEKEIQYFDRCCESCEEEKEYYHLYIRKVKDEHAHEDSFIDIVRTKYIQDKDD